MAPSVSRSNDIASRGDERPKLVAVRNASFSVQISRNHCECRTSSRPFSSRHVPSYEAGTVPCRADQRIWAESTVQPHVAAFTQCHGR